MFIFEYWHRCISQCRCWCRDANLDISKWLQKRLNCMLQFLKKRKLYTKLVPETAPYAVTSKFICDHLFFIIICKSIFCCWNITLNHCFIWKINIRSNFLLKRSLYLCRILHKLYDLLFPFFLSNHSIWHRFCYFVVT